MKEQETDAIKTRTDIKKTAVVLLNMGGPDSLKSVRPFLFNLFNDPAIISAPQPVRWLLARWISSRRVPVAREIYGKIGGSSPLLELTRLQAKALEDEFTNRDQGEVKVFVAMRYWHPMSRESAQEVKSFAPDEIVLLPLYPQFSKTTGFSSIMAWKQAAEAVNLEGPIYTVCCYPAQAGLIREQADLIRGGLNKAEQFGRPRILFSAHGIPKKNADDGDPYVWQVEKTVEAVVGELENGDLDWVVCYQSRVGPQEWVRPYVEDELRRAGKDGVPVVVVPVAFVSEHSETLVELDMKYRHMADEFGVPGFIRIPAVGTGEHFIRGLAEVVTAARKNRMEYTTFTGQRICPQSYRQCPNPGRRTGQVKTAESN